MFIELYWSEEKPRGLGTARRREKKKGKYRNGIDGINICNMLYNW